MTMILIFIVLIASYSMLLQGLPKAITWFTPLGLRFLAEQKNMSEGLMAFVKLVTIWYGYMGDL